MRRTLISIEVAWHATALEVELRDATLFGGEHRMWPAAFFPTWCAERVGRQQLEALHRLARVLDAGLKADAVTAPGCTLDEVLRLAILRTFLGACRSHGVAGEATPVADLLGCGPVLARQLWKDDAERDSTDPAVLYARGHERLLSELWECPPGTAMPPGLAAVTFTRLRPLAADEPRPGARCEVTLLSRASASATSPAERLVWLERLAAHRRGEGWVPRGGERDVEQLAALCEHQLQRQVLLRCSLRPARSRRLEVLLMGFEVDEQGKPQLLVAWQHSLLALPVSRVVSLREGPRTRPPEA